MINLVSICVLVTMVAVCSGSAIPMWEYLARDEKVSHQQNAIINWKTNERTKKLNNKSNNRSIARTFHRNAIIYSCQLLCCGGGSHSHFIFFPLFVNIFSVFWARLRLFKVILISSATIIVVFAAAAADAVVCEECEISKSRLEFGFIYISFGSIKLRQLHCYSQN